MEGRYFGEFVAVGENVLLPILDRVIFVIMIQRAKRVAVWGEGVTNPVVYPLYPPRGVH